MNETLLSNDTLILDDRIRGVPPGTSGLPASAVGALNWHPAERMMTLPVLTPDETAFASNRDAMLAHVRRQGVAIAPHGKTPMAPELARSLVEAGAWGTTVADVRQASVMLRAGLARLILANEVGGIGGARRLAALVAAFPEAELYAFVDSVAAANALTLAWQENPALPPLRILIETGAARAGARTTSEAEAVADAVRAAGGRLQLAGVATYEGAAAVTDPVRTDEIIGSLLAMTGDLMLRLRARVGPDVPLILTAGGSTFFDKVVAKLLPFAREAKAPLLLRSGAIYFHDHGLYDSALAALDRRNGF